jgi:hypothetical protein
LREGRRTSNPARGPEEIASSCFADNTIAVFPERLSVVAGARNHLQANRALAFRFEVTA